MENNIDNVFKKTKKIKIMTHVVAGYPSLAATEELLKEMSDAGVDLIEIQIPFSDPLADGHTIMMANQRALENGTTPQDCLDFVSEISREIPVPLLFMTYANIPYRMKIQAFIEKSAEAGISGLIIPDLPFDEQNDGYFENARTAGIHPILLLSPDVHPDRLKTAVKFASGFIYSTLKVGITGARREIQRNGITFLDTIRRHSPLPLAAGFGISSPEHINNLQGKADCAIIGSHIVNLYNKSGLSAVSEFLHQCRSL